MNHTSLPDSHGRTCKRVCGDHRRRATPHAAAAPVGAITSRRDGCSIRRERGSSAGRCMQPGHPRAVASSRLCAAHRVCIPYRRHWSHRSHPLLSIAQRMPGPHRSQRSDGRRVSSDAQYCHPSGPTQPLPIALQFPFAILGIESDDGQVPSPGEVNDFLRSGFLSIEGIRAKLKLLVAYPKGQATCKRHP
jgi:hypothetical protein